MGFRYDVSRWSEQVSATEIIRAPNTVCKYLTLIINRCSRRQGYAESWVNQIVEVNHAPVGVQKSVEITPKKDL